MRDKYKIGEISKITGIPTQTIRYYEEQGILSPQKKEDSGYRYYDAWDMNFLLDCRYYRSLELTMKETEQLIKNSTLEDIHEKLGAQQTMIMSKIAHYQELLEVLAYRSEDIRKVFKLRGKLRTTTSPPLVFCPVRKQDSYYTGKNPMNGISSALDQYLDLMPLAGHAFQIQYKGADESAAEREYWWGWSLTQEQATRRQISLIPPLMYIPPQKCVYTVFRAHGRGTFLEAFQSQVIDLMIKKGHVVIGTPTGRLLARCHEDGKMQRYFEVWVPV